MLIRSYVRAHTTSGWFIRLTTTTFNMKSHLHVKPNQLVAQNREAACYRASQIIINISEYLFLSELQLERVCAMRAPQSTNDTINLNLNFFLSSCLRKTMPVNRIIGPDGFTFTYVAYYYWITYLLNQRNWNYCEVLLYVGKELLTVSQVLELRNCRIFNDRNQNDEASIKHGILLIVVKEAFVLLLHDCDVRGHPHHCNKWTVKKVIT